MGTRKHMKSNNKNRKTRKKKQKGSGANCSRPGQCTTDQNMEEEDPNTIDEYLEGAVEEELPEYVKEYLVKCANPNVMITDEHEYLQEHELVPAIIYAARHIKPSTILKHLVNHGASVELNINGTTPLIEAAEWGNLSAVKFLLNKNANINATAGSGVTAIGFAILNEDIPMINLMLKKRKGIIDFNYTIFGIDNENVIDDADESAENPEVAKILKKYAIEQKLPIHFARQHKRLELGRCMDKNRMPGDLTYKIMRDHFGGKRKTRTNHRNLVGKKTKRKTRKTRSKRQRGGMYRTRPITYIACGVMYNDEGKILMAKRKANNPNHPNKWEFPGGKKEHGETIFECLEREWKEEMNLFIDITPPPLASMMCGRNKICHFLVGKILDEDELELKEVAEVKYLTENEILELDDDLLLDKNDKLVIQQLKKEGGIKRVLYLEDLKIN